MIDQKWLEYLKNKWAALALLALYLMNVIYTYIWLSKNKVPPGWDGAAHLMLSLDYFQILKDGGWGMIDKFIQLSNYYPPLYESSTSLLYMLFGTSMNVAIMTNSIYLGIILFSTYVIGKRLFNSETALFAVFLISLYPSVIIWQRFYMNEIALVSMVALAIYMLLLTENFQRFWYSIGFGIALALAMLTKWTAIFFLLGPLACVVHDTFSSVTIEQRLRGYKKEKQDVCAGCGKVLDKNYATYQGKNFCSNACKKSMKNRKKESAFTYNKYRNLILALAAAFLLSSIWYIPHLQDIYYNVIVRETAKGAIEGDPGILTLLSAIYYILSMLELQTRLPYFVLFVIGLVFFIKSEHKSKIFLLLWILIPYIAFTLFSNKNSRYTLPIVVAIALISTSWITQVANKKIRTLAVLAIFLIGGVQVFAITTGKLDSLALATKVNIEGFGEFTLFPQGHIPISEDWKNIDALETITQDAKNNPRIQRRVAIAGVVPDVNYVNGYNLAYYARSKNMPVYAINLAYLPSTQVFFENFLNFDYLVLKSGEISTSVYMDKVTSMYGFFEENNKNFYTLIQQYSLPDGSTMYIYKNVHG